MTQQLQVLITGDYYPVKEIEDFHRSNDCPQELFGDLLPTIQSVDYAIYNQEFPLTTTSTTINKSGPNKRGDPICIKSISASGFNVATLANNHILDYGIAGMEDTLSLLESESLQSVGCGSSFEAARAPLVLRAEGVSIAIINCAENEFSNATASSGGAYPLDIVDNCRLLKEIRDEVDHVVMIIHGGLEYCHYPSNRMVDQFRFYVENGASAVICHHSHYIAGYEVFNDAPIFYGLGSLVLPFTGKPGCLESIGVKLKVDKSKLEFEYIPLRFSEVRMRLELLSEDELSEFEDRLNTYCEALSDPGTLQQKWNEHVENELLRWQYHSAISRWPTLLYRLFRKLGLIRLIETAALPTSKRNLGLWNMIRCESHRDVLLHLLNFFLGKKK